jgi:hypothetical protein
VQILKLDVADVLREYFRHYPLPWLPSSQPHL